MTLIMCKQQTDYTLNVSPTAHCCCQSVLQPTLVDIVRRIVMVVRLYSAMWNQAVVMYQLLEYW